MPLPPQLLLLLLLLPLSCITSTLSARSRAKSQFPRSMAASIGVFCCAPLQTNTLTPRCSKSWTILGLLLEGLERATPNTPTLEPEALLSRNMSTSAPPSNSIFVISKFISCTASSRALSPAALRLLMEAPDSTRKRTTSSLCLFVAR